jgi:hypothetical protein
MDKPYYSDVYGTWCKSCGCGMLTKNKGGLTCGSSSCEHYTGDIASQYIKEFWKNYNKNRGFFQ